MCFGRAPESTGHSNLFSVHFNEMGMLHLVVLINDVPLPLSGVLDG